MTNYTMLESTPQLKIKVHEAFNLQVDTLTHCQHFNHHTNHYCSTTLSSASIYTIHQILLAFAFQAPSNQHSDGFTVHNLSMISMLTCLARNVFCTEHSDTDLISRRVIQWLEAAANNPDLFTLHADFRGAMHDIAILMPYHLEGTLTDDMYNAFRMRVLQRRPLITFLREFCQQLRRMENPYWDDLDPYTEDVIREALQRLFGYNVNVNSVQNHYNNSLNLNSHASSIVGISAPNPPPIPTRSPLRNVFSNIYQPPNVEPETHCHNTHEEVEECSICLEHVTSSDDTTCTHCQKRFHWECIYKWATEQRVVSAVTCPLCRGVWFDQEFDHLPVRIRGGGYDDSGDGDADGELFGPIDGVDSPVVMEIGEDSDDENGNELEVYEQEYDYDDEFADSIVGSMIITHEDDGSEDNGNGGDRDGGDGGDKDYESGSDNDSDEESESESKDDNDDSSSDEEEDNGDGNDDDDPGADCYQHTIEPGSGVTDWFTEQGFK